MTPVWINNWIPVLSAWEDSNISGREENFSERGFSYEASLRDALQLARLNHVPRLLGVFRPYKLISPPGGLPSERLETALLISEHLTPRVCHARQGFNFNRQDAQPPPDSIGTLGITSLDNGNPKPILIYPNSETRYLSYLASDLYR
ncbi:unnamed protein product [Fusarium fujikuroi]|uniref:Uncharacterized protein n=1 Tax=Fusarium fujikuroi TaxID=5127 RepID=A0A9Q9RCA8_FUSFU|nr:uncharacterized protein FFFS_15103 [Fusarium fujikuroi]VTT56435.1 unnamed protein product [Fusarium fujikuroi]VTT77530.1 unnamed protein product [Fusarium fujikuroi]VZI14526.1 unnamed protein product [Fusarium fujikuroi]